MLIVWRDGDEMVGCRDSRVVTCDVLAMWQVLLTCDDVTIGSRMCKKFKGAQKTKYWTGSWLVSPAAGLEKKNLPSLQSHFKSLPIGLATISEG